MIDPKIGGASFQVTADISNLESELDRGESVARAKSQGIANALEGVGQKLEDNTAGARKFTGALSSMVGSLTAVTGIATALVGVLVLLDKALNDKARVAREATETVNDLSVALDRMADARLEGLDAELRAIATFREDARAELANIEGATDEQLRGLLARIEDESSARRKDAFAAEADAYRNRIRLAEDATTLENKLRAEGLAAEVEAIKPRIVDVLNGYLRAIDIASLEDPATLPRLRAQMLRRVQVVTDPGRVEGILIMEFVLS